MTVPPWEVKRELIVKVEAETDPTHGCIPKNRTIPDLIKYGLVNLDKPSGPTSHEVVAWVKKILKINRAGHGGTLDPKVTGVLPIALEEARKILGIFLLSIKEYVCVMRIHGEIPDEKITQAIKQANTDIKSGADIKTYPDEKRKGFRWCAIKDYPPIPCGGLHVKNAKEIGEIILVSKKIEQGNQRITITIK